MRDEKIRLYDEELNLAIAWSGSNTFNVHDGKYGDEIDCFTVYRDDMKKHTRLQAVKIILKHFDELKTV